MSDEKLPKHVVVVTGVVIKGDKFLAGKRKDEDGDFGGYWCVPGGKVEENEGLIEALEQEMIEETGANIANPVLVQVFDFSGKKDHYLGLTFACDYSGGDIKAGDDMQNMQWLTEEEFLQKKYLRFADSQIRSAFTYKKTGIVNNITVNKETK